MSVSNHAITYLAIQASHFRSCDVDVYLSCCAVAYVYLSDLTVWVDVYLSDLSLNSLILFALLVCLMLRLILCIGLPVHLPV